MLLLSPAGQGVWVDAGSMDPASGSPAHPFENWISLGLPDAQLDAAEPPAFVDVYLERIPEGKLSALVAIRSALDLSLSPMELKEAMHNVPARIARNVPYGKTLVRCRRLNDVHDCLTLRAVDDSSKVIPT